MYNMYIYIIYIYIYIYRKTYKNKITEKAK